jgi:hypothetical protein
VTDAPLVTLELEMHQFKQPCNKLSVFRPRNPGMSNQKWYLLHLFSKAKIVDCTRGGIQLHASAQEDEASLMKLSEHS